MSTTSLLSHQSNGSALSHQSNGSVLSSQCNRALLGHRTRGTVPPRLVSAAVIAVLAVAAVHRASRRPV
ncbi:hypothetical protein GCM10027600_15450 [Nocardioides ginsengisegetis]